LEFLKRANTSWAFIWRGWLRAVALLVGLLACYVIVTEETPLQWAGARDRPFAQIAQDDLDAPVWSLAISPRGTHLASATSTGDIWLKTLATGRSVCLVKGSSSVAYSLAFSPDGRILVLPCDTSAVRLWAVDTGTELAALELGTTGHARCVAFAPD